MKKFQFRAMVPSNSNNNALRNKWQLWLHGRSSDHYPPTGCEKAGVAPSPQQTGNPLTALYARFFVLYYRTSSTNLQRNGCLGISLSASKNNQFENGAASVNLYNER
jgi:hypothetical protein